MDRGVVPTNQNPRLTRLRQPRSVRGDREGRIGSSWVSVIGVQVQYREHCPISPPHPAHLTAVITPPARIKPRLGQKVHIAKIPKPTGFGFGSLVQPKAANRIVKSSGPVPSTNIVTPPPINISGNRNRARVLAAGLGALTPKSGGR